MPDSEIISLVTKEWLQSELRSAKKDLIVLDCRSFNDYAVSHVRSAVNFSIPSIMLRRLAAGKIDITSTIKNKDLKTRIFEGLQDSTFVLYNDVDSQENNNNQSNCADMNENNIINVLNRRLKTVKVMKGNKMAADEREMNCVFVFVICFYVGAICRFVLLLINSG